MKLGYVELFLKLGYDVPLPRSDVSAERAGGIALAIFRDELHPKPLAFDTRSVPDWESKRMHLPGNTKRIGHIEKALELFDGHVDVVLVDKSANGDSDGAEPWQRPKSHWKITYFDPATGHHRVELIRE